MQQQTELLKSNQEVIGLLTKLVHLMEMEKRGYTLAARSIEETLIRRFGQELVDQWKSEAFGGKPEVGVLLA